MIESYYWDRLCEIASNFPRSAGGSGTTLEFVCGLIDEFRNNIPLDEAIRIFVIKMLRTGPAGVMPLRRPQVSSALPGVGERYLDDPFAAALEDIAQDTKH